MTAVAIGLGLMCFGPAGEALYLNLHPRHISVAFVVFWVVAWYCIGWGTAWRLAGRDVRS